MPVKNKLPNKYLSYSALYLWYTNKNQFRKRYYLKEKGIETRYTLFGKTAHESIETDVRLTHIPKLPIKEHEIKVKIDGVPIRAFIDTFDKKTLAFYEYKTGLQHPDGAARWNLKRVQEHKQLPFYALLIREKYGKYNPNTLLILLETAWNNDSVKIGDTEVIFSEDLQLTGRSEIFTRTITDEELEDMRKWIVTGYNQIVEDYDWWKHVDGKNNLK